jgi:hypothetical protein
VATPTGYGFGNQRTSNMTAPATVAPTSTFTPRATGQTAKDLLAQAATLSARPGTSVLSARMTAPATVAPTATFTARAQMDAMETLRQAATLTPRSAPGVAGTPVAGYRTPTMVAEETARAAGAQMDRYAQERAAQTAAATEPRTRGLGAPVAAGMSAAPTDDFRAAPASAPGISPDSLPSSVAAINNAKMAQSDEFSPSMPAPAPGNRVGFGAFTGANVAAVDPARMGYDPAAMQAAVRSTTPQMEMARSPTYDTPYENARQIAGATTPATAIGGVQTAANDIRANSPAAPTGIDVLTPTTKTAGLKAANLREQYATAKYTPAAGAPTTQVATTQPDYVTAAFQPQPTDKPTRQASVAAAEEYEEGKVPAEQETTVPEEQQTAAADEAKPAFTPPKGVTVQKPTVKTVPVDYKRSKAGWAKAIAIDIGTALHPVGWAANLASMALTGESLGGAIADASGGRWGENQYKGSEHLNDGGSNRPLTSSTTTASTARPETTDDAGPTFEEKYLDFNDPTWRPTPPQKWGPNPTHSEYV